ncbi:MAG: hypothetical protein RSC99_10550 [Clostridiales bacterium]
MKNMNSYFNKEQLDLLSSINIKFSNEQDYSDDMLLDIHDIITNNYTDVGFDKEGMPTSLAPIYEKIIDIFYDKFDI